MGLSWWCVLFCGGLWRRQQTHTVPALRRCVVPELWPQLLPRVVASVSAPSETMTLPAASHLSSSIYGAMWRRTPDVHPAITMRSRAARRALKAAMVRVGLAVPLVGKTADPRT